MKKLDWVKNKVVTVEELVHRVHGWRFLGKKIVFTNGCFDILHHGHLDYLAKAAEEGNILIIGLNADASVKRLKGEDRPVNHEQDRALQLASLMLVDAVCLFEEDTPLRLIKAIMPDVLAKGGDYTIETIVGANEVMNNGGKVAIIPFVEGYSTTSLIAQIKKL